MVRTKLKKTFSKKKNQRRAIYVLSFLIIVGLTSGVVAQRQQLDNKQKHLNMRVSELERLNQALQDVQNQKAGTELELKAKAASEAELKRQIDDLNNQLQSKKAAERTLASKVINAVTFTKTVSAQGNCAEWLVQAGVTDLASANTLISRESGCHPCKIHGGAINCDYKGSLACGVAQELPCGKSGCNLGDGACQVRWMNSYVVGRYGSWAAALAHSYAYNWY